VKDLAKMKFRGSFRDYQQKVLDNSRRHLSDGRIHIVAAPGSGKTILGLELIRRQNAPALILSPSVTIRQQWGQRFSESFLPEGENEADYISYDLRSPSLLTSITYQALHAAFTRTELQGDEDSELENEADADYSGFDLLGTVKKAGIRTLCLDEAHHLKSEWQRALEGFIEKLGEVKIIALTATPPYDSTPAEWSRYIGVCGEIDEEIFVPQLVKQKTLCPHQDFVYLSFPTEEEQELLQSYRNNAEQTLRELMADGSIEAALDETVMPADDFILENSDSLAALLSLADRCGRTFPENITKAVCGLKGLPEFNLETAEKALTLMCAYPELFGGENAERVKSRLSQSGLMERRRVCLTVNDKLSRTLAASAGKLQSINSIIASAAVARPEGMHLLILTDYIKRGLKKTVGTDEKLSSLGTVPIFESVRREFSKKLSVAMLSGTMVIIPDAITESVCAIAEKMKVSADVKPIDNTEHSEIIFSGSNKNKVAVLTEAFENDLIDVLIGTKSLLGEGWDSPCIDELILASCVGSFMLSNQMRGRAIRTDKRRPEKCANIWHLVTLTPDMPDSELSPEYGEDELHGSDWDSVRRRFDGFLAPAYTGSTVESGIGRLSFIAPPYDEKGIEAINAKMLSASVNREETKQKWDSALRDKNAERVMSVCEIPEAAAPESKMLGAVLGFAVPLAVGTLILIAAKLLGFLSGLFALIVGIAALADALRALPRLKLSTPAKRIKASAECILNTLIEIGAIESRDAELRMRQEDGSVLLCLDNASSHEKDVLTKAVAEYFSAILEPRYLLIKETRIFGRAIKHHADSHACPSAIGSKKENAGLLRKQLSRRFGSCGIFYTKSESGRELLQKCRAEAFLNSTELPVGYKKVAGLEWK